MRVTFLIFLLAWSASQIAHAESQYGVMTEHVLARDSAGDEWQLVRGQLVRVLGKAGGELLVQDKLDPGRTLQVAKLQVLPVSRFRKLSQLAQSCTVSLYIGECNFRYSARSNGTYTAEAWCGDVRAKRRSSGALYAFGPYMVARRAGTGTWEHGFQLDGEGNRTCETP